MLTITFSSKHSCAEVEEASLKDIMLLSNPPHSHEQTGFDEWLTSDDLIPFSEYDDATDADEMTTFDGSTISLSLSPLMTPAKHGN